MEPLSKEEISAMQHSMEQLFDELLPMQWRRLFYSALLGAEFVKQTQKVVDTEAKQV